MGLGRGIFLREVTVQSPIDHPPRGVAAYM
jgi:hypothetical protein